MDPPVAAERLGHTDGGALFLKTYRHLYEHERKRQVAKLGRLVERELKKAAQARHDQPHVPRARASVVVVARWGAGKGLETCSSGAPAASSSCAHSVCFGNCSPLAVGWVWEFPR